MPSMVPFCKLHAPHGPCKPTNFQIYDKRHRRYVPALTNQTVMRRTRGNSKKLMRPSMTKKITSKVSSNRWETMLRQWDLCPPPFMPSWQARKIILCQVVWRILKIHSKERYTWPWHLEEMLILL